LSGLKGLLGGLGKGAGSLISSVGAIFGFARGGMIHGIPGIDKIPGFAAGKAGKVSPIAVTSQESILNREATAALGEPFINAINADPRAVMKGPIAKVRASELSSGISMSGLDRYGDKSHQVTLEALDKLQSSLTKMRGQPTRIEVPERVLNMSMQRFLEDYFDTVTAKR
jgi:hypothetical protein